jgi:phosphoribosylanthranilate isomerase
MPAERDSPREHSPERETQMEWPMFRIKICGITQVDDALAAVAAGADAVGLNFFPKSPRYVLLDNALPIVDSLPAGIVKVGVFVNAPADEVCRTFDRLGLDLIQLHGDEPPEFPSSLGGRPVMRAFRFGPGGLAAVADHLRQAAAGGGSPRLALIDAYRRGQYGGTGQVANWAALADYAAIHDAPPLVLSGGLTAKNVADAIRAVRPAAVDAASGVESSPGQKDPALVGEFVRAARTAFKAS